jgi:hypothetical protein
MGTDYRRIDIYINSFPFVDPHYSSAEGITDGINHEVHHCIIENILVNDKLKQKDSHWPFYRGIDDKWFETEFHLLSKYHDRCPLIYG